MAERDPDVIERMYRAYINADVVGPEAMLAAVRWLKDHADQLSTNEETRAAVWGVLNFAIVKHERWLDIGRRAGGKGE